MVDFSVIITAGGIGKRMGGKTPKQFIEIAGKPILFHTMERFHRFNADFQIIITLPADWMDYWKSLLQKHQFDVPHKVVSGGEERFHSIKNAIAHCQGSYIMVHDGVRPFVSNDTIDRCIAGLRKGNAVIPVIDVKESIRQKTEQGTVAVKRVDYFIVQTPQCFLKSTIEKAYEQEFHVGITDDATLVEELGEVITCIEGNPENIKITTPQDIILAEGLLK